MADRFDGGDGGFDDGNRLGGGVAADVGAATVVDGELNSVGAGLFVKVRRGGAVAFFAVPEIPEIGEAVAIEIHRTGTVKTYLFIGAPDARAAGDGCRRAVEDYQCLVVIRIAGQAGVIIDRQLGGVRASLGVGVSHAHTFALFTVPEIP